MMLTDSEVAERINAICVGPGGLRELDPKQAQLIACSVMANIVIATGWHPELALRAFAKTYELTLDALPRLRGKMQ